MLYFSVSYKFILFVLFQVNIQQQCNTVIRVIVVQQREHSHCYCYFYMLVHLQGDWSMIGTNHVIKHVTSYSDYVPSYFWLSHFSRFLFFVDNFLFFSSDFYTLYPYSPAPPPFYPTCSSVLYTISIKFPSTKRAFTLSLPSPSLSISLGIYLHQQSPPWRSAHGLVFQQET